VSISVSPSQRRVHPRLWARIALVAVEGFVALGAVYGSILLITDAWQLDREMLRQLPVDTWVVPGVALAVLVAVPNLIAGVLAAIGHRWALKVSMVTGGVLVGWIIVQIAVIQQFFYLQPVMGICGLLTIILACLLPGHAAR
jgi:hypothetical protein